MDKIHAELALEGLSELDVDNLVAGRFTKEAVQLVVLRLRTVSYFHLDTLGKNSSFASNADRMLADELNDILRAARWCQDKGYVWKGDTDA